MRTRLQVFALFSLLVSAIPAIAQPPYLSWAGSIGGTGYDAGYSNAIDASGNMYTAGIFSGTSDFDAGAGVSNLISAGSYDAFVTKHDNAGNLLWAKSIGGTGADWAYELAVDALGNVYVGGSITGTADLDPGAGTNNVTSAGGDDFYIVKLDASGNYVWGWKFGNTGSDKIYGLHVDASSNVYATGHFRGTIDFNPGAGTANLSALIQDMFILKLDGSGNYLWALDMGGSAAGNFAQGMSTTTDASGNVFIGGSYQGTVDLDPGAGTVSATSASGDDGYIIKLNSSGTYVWSRTIGSAGSFVYKIKTDASGNVYSTGYFYTSADFDPGAGVFTVAASGYDAFAWKLNSTGNFVWAKAWGGVNFDMGSSLYLDASANVYITGSFSGTADFNPGAGSYPLASFSGTDDVFILKLDASGEFQMAIHLGGNDYDRGYSIVTDGTGMIYTTGYYLETVDFDPGAATYNLTSAGSNDIFLAKYSQTIILPVSLVNFSATLTSDQKVKLNWQTASEQNVSEFKIERSADGRNYTPIGFITAAGNSAATKDYSFTDIDPKAVNIYRIKSLDADGKFQYSTTIMIRFAGSGAGLTAFPNPVKNVLQLQTSMKGNLDVKVYDAAGNMVSLSMFRNEASAFSFSLEMSRLSKGLYLVTVNNGIETEKLSIIKE